MEGKFFVLAGHWFFTYEGVVWMIKEECLKPTQSDLPHISTYHFFHADPYGVQLGCDCESRSCPLKASYQFFRRVPDEFLLMAKEFTRMGIDVKSISTSPSTQAMNAFVEIMKTKHHCYFGVSECDYGGGANQQVRLFWRGGAAQRE